MNVTKDAREVFDKEIAALSVVRDSLGEEFEKIINEIVSCKGKVVVTGIGKAGHIARKIASTFSSLGTSSFFLHPAEGLHGDLGMVSKGDTVIVISNSGESEEILRILPNLKLIGAKLIAVTGNKESTLAKSCDYCQIFPKITEACSLGLAPTSSTTAALVYGDALAVVASKEHGFRTEDFGKFHPAGSLGKKILYKVKDLMTSGENDPKVDINSNLYEAINELSKKGLGVVNIVDADSNLKGIITDGDLRRLLEKRADVYGMGVEEAMNSSPITVTKDLMVVDALKIMKEKKIGSLVVVDAKRLVGTLKMSHIIEAGILI
jgi:arabinose-5-phosphate isomerase